MLSFVFILSTLLLSFTPTSVTGTLLQQEDGSLLTCSSTFMNRKPPKVSDCHSAISNIPQAVLTGDRKLYQWIHPETKLISASIDSKPVTSHSGTCMITIYSSEFNAPVPAKLKPALYAQLWLKALDAAYDIIKHCIVEESKEGDYYNRIELDGYSDYSFGVSITRC
jgi:hypothetical protein